MKKDLAIEPIFSEREFWMLMRQALLLMLDALERKLEISPRTAELRRAAKGDKLERGRILESVPEM